MPQPQTPIPFLSLFLRLCTWNHALQPVLWVHLTPQDIKHPRFTHVVSNGRISSHGCGISVCPSATLSLLIHQQQLETDLFHLSVTVSNPAVKLGVLVSLQCTAFIFFDYPIVEFEVQLGAIFTIMEKPPPPEFSVINSLVYPLLNSVWGFLLSTAWPGQHLPPSSLLVAATLIDGRWCALWFDLHFL